MVTKFEPVLTGTTTVWVKGQWNALHPDENDYGNVFLFALGLNIAFLSLI